MIDWTTIKHFAREEWRHDPDRISPDLVMLMDQMRDAAGVPIWIHVAWDGEGHVADSGHYTTSRELAVAVDFHFEAWPLLQQWLFAERFPWNGIGLYPHWQQPGLHVDLRRIGREHADLGRRWWRDRDGTYKALDEDFIRWLVT